MSQTLDPRLIEAIDEIARRQFSDDWETKLAPLAVLLSKRYRHGRSLTPYLRKEVQPYAYMAAFLPRYMPRLTTAFRSAGINLKALLKIKSGCLRILDLGCGPGTFSLAILDALEGVCTAIGPRVKVEILARDKEKNALDLATQLITRLYSKGYCPHIDLSFRTEEADLYRPVTGQFDVVIIGHAFCELYQHDPPGSQITHYLKQLSEALESAIERRGIGIMIEPYLYDQPTASLQTRDYFRKSKVFHVIGPCPGAALQCPAWKSNSRECASKSPRVTWRADMRARNWRFFL